MTKFFWFILFANWQKGLWLLPYRSIGYSVRDVQFINQNRKEYVDLKHRGGGTDLERGYGDVRFWRDTFHTSPVVRKGPISSKRVSSQTHFWENLEILASVASIFAQTLAQKPPNLEIFSSQAFQIWKFSIHKLLLSGTNISSQAPHIGNPGHTPLPEKKKLSDPLPGLKGKMKLFCLRLK